MPSWSSGAVCATRARVISPVGFRTRWGMSPGMYASSPATNRSVCSSLLPQTHLQLALDHVARALDAAVQMGA
jgi:hypothetical protein